MKKIIYIILLLNSYAFPNMIGVDTQTFNPSPQYGPGFSLMTEDSQKGKHQLFLSIWTDYASKSLANFDDVNSNNLGFYRDAVWFSHLMIDYKYKKFSAGLSAPYVLSHSFEDGLYDLQYVENGFVELRPHIMFELLKSNSFGNWAAYTSVNFNLLEDNFYLGKESDPVINFGFLGSKNLSTNINANLNIGYRYRNPGRAHFNVPIAPYDDQLFAGAGLDFSLWRSKKISGALETTLSIPLSKENSSLERDSYSQEVLLGARKTWNDFDFKFGGTAGIAGEHATPQWRVFMGLGYLLDFNKTKIFKKDNMIAVEESLVINPELTTKTREVKSFTIPNIYFDFNNSNLRPEGQKIVQQIVEYLEENQAVDKVILEGHTDAHGTDEYNQKLGKARAQSVFEAIVTKLNGVRPLDIETTSMGEDQMAKNANSPYESVNRRVEVKLYDK